MGATMADNHGDQQQPRHEGKPDTTAKPPWRDPGSDDTGLRHEAPENIVNRMLRRDD